MYLSTTLLLSKNLKRQPEVQVWCIRLTGNGCNGPHKYIEPTHIAMHSFEMNWYFKWTKGSGELYQYNGENGFVCLFCWVQGVKIGTWSQWTKFG